MRNVNLLETHLLRSSRPLAGGPPPPVSQQETVTDLLRQAQRGTVPIRRDFVQQGRGEATTPGPLSSFVASHDERGLDAYLFVHALASGPPWDCEYPSGMWIRALGLTETATLRSARGLVSKVMRRLQDRKLIRRGRTGRLSAVTLLREDGSGETYEHPFVEGNYFNLPHAYWLEGHYRAMSLPAKAALLIALSLPANFYIPYEKAKPWYGISGDTAGRGLRELQRMQILAVERRWEKNHRSDTGWVEQRYYTLLGPYSKQAPDRGVDDEAPAEQPKYFGYKAGPAEPGVA